MATPTNQTTCATRKSRSPRPIYDCDQASRPGNYHVRNDAVSRIESTSTAALMTEHTKIQPGPGLLFKLPREIRDTIYGYLFASEREVLIIDSVEMSKEPAWLVEDEYNFQEEDCHVEHLKGKPFHALELEFPVSFFRTCQQIREEATPIMYEKNMFIVSVAKHRHNPALRQLRTFVRWIESLGQLYKLLKKIVIDVRLICDCACPFGREETDFV